MKLEQALDGFLERVRADDVELGPGDKERGSRATRQLAKDLDLALKSINRWRIFSVIVVLAFACASALTRGIWQAASVAAAGAVTTALLSIWRRKFAGDVLVALLKSTNDLEQQIKLVQLLRERL